MAATAISGIYLFDGASQITLGWPGWALTVAAVAFFFLLAMPTVARVRFSAPALGREGLIGKLGSAITDLVPNGVVEVGGENGRPLPTGRRPSAPGIRSGWRRWMETRWKWLRWAKMKKHLDRADSRSRFYCFNES